MKNEKYLKASYLNNDTGSISNFTFLIFNF